jgi:alkylation response protein AidB-like acyl-CoA dehydrogenase
MQLAESDEIGIMRQMVREFLDREVTPALIAEWDAADHIPREIVAKLGELGLCGLTVPEEYGGLGRDVLGLVAVLEELSTSMLGLGGIFVMNAGYGSLNVSALGTDEQKARLLPGLLSGETLFAYGLSEPDVGADLAAVKTKAVRDGDRVIINGTKRWCSGADIADYIYALVSSGPPEARRENLSFVIIPTNTPGITMTRTETMGAHGTATNDVNFDDVVLSINDVMGGEAGWNQGWKMLSGPSLEVEKLVTPALAVGVARGAVAEAWEYSQQRMQGGKHIAAHQAVRHVLADVQTKLLSCQLMLNHAAGLVNAGMPSAVETSMAKLYISETAKQIVLDCQQYVMGAYGYAKGFNMERYVRDILVFPIFGGSTAIQRNNVANLLRLPRE